MNIGPALEFRLPNARAGQAYQQQLLPINAAGEAIVLLAVTFPPELDLRADLASHSVSGVALVANEYSVEVLYHLRSEDAAACRMVRVPLLVTPDPKSLWKDLPSDRSAPFWKEDAVCAAVTGQQMQVIAASKRGRSHAHVGSFRDDDYFISHRPESDWVTAIVADGAGSARFSREGARLVCEAAGAYLEEALEGAVGATITDAAAAFHAERSNEAATPAAQTARQSLHNALYMALGHAAFHAVKTIAEATRAHTELQATAKDFSTTALIAIARRFPFGTLCAAYWVGDGAVGIYRKDKGVTLLGTVDSGEFAGQTRFLDAGEVSAEALLRRTRFDLVDDMTALILMTDGVSDAWFNTEASLERAAPWDALWAELEQSVQPCERSGGAEQRLLAWLDFWSQGNHDDRTIAIVTQE
ncbi:MAG: PP2C family serine/threonine-protein phosphatase [Pseudomonadota bacterium]